MSTDLPEGFDSIFRYIAVVSQRAEQLINGAKVRSESRSSKSTLQAKDDVDQGMVEWRVLTQEEIDAQRQAIVDQFRAEVGADELPAIAGGEVPDVLRTEPAHAAADGGAAAEPEEKDDELARLQRLLGLTISDPKDSPDTSGGEDEEETEDDFGELPDEDDLALDVEEESFEDQNFEGESFDDEEEDE